MIHNSQIMKTLLKTSGGIPIKIKQFGTDLMTVYITKVYKGAVWATHVNLTEDLRIFPSKKIEILQIGKDKVQTLNDYKEELKAYKEYMREKSKKKNNYCSKERLGINLNWVMVNQLNKQR